MGYIRLLFIGLFACGVTAAAPAGAGDHASRAATSVAEGGRRPASDQVPKAARTTEAAPLDRVALAVDGAESSHGRDLAMWRPDPSGPQGPMQVSEAAATDVGGGDRFDLEENRALGRAYLALLHQRYGNWPDAVAAYNWGIGRMDAWIKAGRRPEQFLAEVAVYQSRVLSQSGLCAEPAISRRGGSAAATSDRLITAECDPGAWRESLGIGVRANHFVKKLDQAMQLTALRAAQTR